MLQVIVGVLCGLTLAALAGAGSAVLVVLFAERGERRRFVAELAPVRESVGELADRFDHLYKREAKRARDAEEGPGRRAAPGADQAEPLTRADRIRALRQRRAASVNSQVSG